MIGCGIIYLFESVDHHFYSLLSFSHRNSVHRCNANSLLTIYQLVFALVYLDQPGKLGILHSSGINLPTYHFVDNFDR